MNRVYVNGRFLAQRTTGVQRVAGRLVAALDEQVEGGWTLLCPPGVTLPALRNIAVSTIGRAGAPLHAWEQTTLPAAARDGLLLNLAGSAPALAHRQACMLHDAAVFDVPHAYRRAFVVWYRWLFRRLARTAERLYTVSAYSRARLALRLAIDPARIAVVANGGDHLDAVPADDTILDRHALRGMRFVLAVGSDNPTKNHAALVRAHAALAVPGTRLVIVGGDNARVFAQAAAPDDVAAVVRTGPLDDAPLKALYAHAAALVFPSTYEGFGLPPLEAMSCGCPVAAADAASIPEVCGDAALYFDPLAVPSITAAMQRLLSEEPLRERLRVAGRQRSRRYRWADSAAALRAALPTGARA